MPQFHRFLANPPGLDEDCVEDCGRYSVMLDAAGRCYAAVSSLDSEEVFRSQRFRSFDCVQVLQLLRLISKDASLLSAGCLQCFRISLHVACCHVCVQTLVLTLKRLRVGLW